MSQLSKETIDKIEKDSIQCNASNKRMAYIKGATAEATRSLPLVEALHTIANEWLEMDNHELGQVAIEAIANYTKQQTFLNK